jgi:four helix bundle protein
MDQMDQIDQFYIAQQIGYLEREKYEELKARGEKISGMLGNLIKALKKGK